MVNKLFMAIQYSQEKQSAMLEVVEISVFEGKEIKVEEYIQMTVRLLEELIEEEGEVCPSIFNSETAPNISIERYIKRLQKITKFSPQCLVIAIVYFDRYNMAEPEFILNRFNVHRFFLTCILLAVKYQDDIYFDNLTYEKAGGVAASQLKSFQEEIFSKLNFTCYINTQQYKALAEKLYSLYILHKTE